MIRGRGGGMMGRGGGAQGGPPRGNNGGGGGGGGAHNSDSDSGAMPGRFVQRSDRLLIASAGGRDGSGSISGASSVADDDASSVGEGSAPDLPTRAPVVAPAAASNGVVARAPGRGPAGPPGAAGASAAAAAAAPGVAPVGARRRVQLVAEEADEEEERQREDEDSLDDDDMHYRRRRAAAGAAGKHGTPIVTSTAAATVPVPAQPPRAPTPPPPQPPPPPPPPVAPPSPPKPSHAPPDLVPAPDGTLLPASLIASLVSHFSYVPDSSGAPPALPASGAPPPPPPIVLAAVVGMLEAAGVGREVLGSGQAPNAAAFVSPLPPVVTKERITAAMEAVDTALRLNAEAIPTAEARAGELRTVLDGKRGVWGRYQAVVAAAEAATAAAVRAAQQAAAAAAAEAARQAEAARAARLARVEEALATAAAARQAFLAQEAAAAATAATRCEDGLQLGDGGDTAMVAPRSLPVRTAAALRVCTAPSATLALGSGGDFGVAVGELLSVPPPPPPGGVDAVVSAAAHTVALASQWGLGAAWQCQVAAASAATSAPRAAATWAAKVAEWARGSRWPPAARQGGATAAAAARSPASLRLELGGATAAPAAVVRLIEVVDDDVAATLSARAGMAVAADSGASAPPPPPAVACLWTTGSGEGAGRRHFVALITRDHAASDAVAAALCGDAGQPAALRRKGGAEVRGVNGGSGAAAPVAYVPAALVAEHARAWRAAAAAVAAQLLDNRGRAVLAHGKLPCLGAGLSADGSDDGAGRPRMEAALPPHAARKSAAWRQGAVRCLTADAPRVLAEVAAGDSGHAGRRPRRHSVTFAAPPPTAAAAADADVVMKDESGAAAVTPLPLVAPARVAGVAGGVGGALFLVLILRGLR